MPAHRGFVWLVGLVGLLLPGIWADIPVNCTYNEVAGKWTLYEGSRIHNGSIDCSSIVTVARKLRVDLRYPDIAVDEYGNHGHWTMIYNEGFEVTVNQRTFFAFFYFTKDDVGNVTSHCDRTFPSWSHDVTLRHWACFYGRKQTPVMPKMHQDPFHDMSWGEEVLTRESMQQLVDSINTAQTSWTAKVYENFVGKTRSEMLKISGGKRSWLPHKISPARPSSRLQAAASTLPPAFDWRNVDGVNFVSPVRDQGMCGSCYAFSAMGMLEARLRVQTNNTLQVQLSPQDVVSCSKLSQGCEGGFPFLVAGKYGKEFGTVEESCNPYKGRDGPCTGRTCLKHYTASYSYVGGYYGACNEELMKMELLRGGPFSVSFEVTSDFQHYNGGIYHHTGLGDFNPLEAVNHAVLLVGYGVDHTTGEKFWIVKNSWGTGWGEDGFFRIRRGTDEVAIESCGVHVTPIP
ncbi:dipeptidyl peptidase 1-like [Periplaneta americana]|uniref:dipeptidyl peptidase 1-like n=1 Tax=Periplaneta americana TaxID=6978 RepID=UPI0037E89306